MAIQNSKLKIENSLFGVAGQLETLYNVGL